MGTPLKSTTQLRNWWKCLKEDALSMQVCVTFVLLKDQISVLQAYQNVINPVLVRRIPLPIVRNDFVPRES